MAEQLLHADGVTLCVETFGSQADPAILLIAGGTQSMVWWEAEFCERLAAAGRFVVRYDHRDTGRSTSSPPGQPAYTAADLMSDPTRILHGLGLQRAHLVGLSLGGGIGQCLAVTAPDRVRSLTLMASSPAVSDEGSPLPGPEPHIMASFADPDPEPDWGNRSEVLNYRVDAERPYVGSLGFDEERVRRLAALEVDRTTDMAASMTNHFVLGGDPWPTGARLEEIRTPTLVLHGTTDPLFPLAHGRALARLISGARLVELVGVGHQQPPPERWDVTLDALVTHTAKAG